MSRRPGGAALTWITIMFGLTGVTFQCVHNNEPFLLQNAETVLSSLTMDLGAADGEVCRVLIVPFI